MIPKDQRTDQAPMEPDMITRHAEWNRRDFARRALATIGAGLLALPSLGCKLIAPPVEATRTSTIAHVAGSSLSVETGNGAITVEAKPGVKEVTVVAKLKARTQERLDATRVLAERAESGVLKVYVLWPDNTREGNEGCAFEITLPDVRGVNLRSSNGAISLEGSSGDADLHTSNGRVTVKGHDGGLKVKSSNGAITGTGVSGAVDADTSNGAITFTLAPGSAGPVELETSNGAVTLHVGRAFAGELAVKTSNGALTLPGGPGVVIKDRDKRSATLTFGEGGKASKVRTSNGAVTVTLDE